MSCLDNKLDDRIIIAGSLSKAFGSHGGFIACNYPDTINFIKTYGTTYAFGGPPSLQELLHVSQQQIYTSMAQYPRVKMNYNKL